MAIPSLKSLHHPGESRDPDCHLLFKARDDVKSFLFLIGLLILPVGGFAAESEKVTFKTREGIPLHALYVQAKEKNPTAILLHGLGSAKEEWNHLIKPLTDVGWGVLAYDARGHGASARGPGEYKGFGIPGPNSPWSHMIDDVGAAIQFVKERSSGTGPLIYLVGASLGANVALNYGVLGRSIEGVVLLSPGEKYMGIETTNIISRADQLRILIIASKMDEYAYKGSQILSSKARHATFWTDVIPGHGVQMFDSSLIGRIIQWLRKPSP